MQYEENYLCYPDISKLDYEIETDTLVKIDVIREIERQFSSNYEDTTKDDICTELKDITFEIEEIDENIAKLIDIRVEELGQFRKGIQTLATLLSNAIVAGRITFKLIDDCGGEDDKWGYEITQNNVEPLTSMWVRTKDVKEFTKLQSKTKTKKKKRPTSTTNKNISFDELCSLYTNIIKFARELEIKIGEILVQTLKRVVTDIEYQCEDYDESWSVIHFRSKILEERERSTYEASLSEAEKYFELETVNLENVIVDVFPQLREFVSSYIYLTHDEAAQVYVRLRKLKDEGV